MVSYNGYLNLADEHWSEIVKTLTVIADHRVSLFVDFVDKLGAEEDEEEEEEVD